MQADFRIFDNLTQKYLTGEDAVQMAQEAGNAHAQNGSGEDSDSGDRYIVEPYIGRNDRNGTKIYEGDIVKDENAQLLGAVVYDENELSFVVEDVDDGPQLYGEYIEECLIVGNKHVDTKLLEAADNSDEQCDSVDYGYCEDKDDDDDENEE